MSYWHASNGHNSVPISGSVASYIRHSLLHAINQSRAPWSTSSVAARMSWGKGVTTKCYGLWRTQSVLRFLTVRISILPKWYITFVRAGEKAQHQPSSSGGFLTTAHDWQLQVDPGKHLKFPENIISTRLRSDMVLTSESSKQVVLLELNVPWEDGIKEVNVRKRNKIFRFSAGAKAGEPAVSLLKLDAGALLAILYSEHSNSLE